jgi:hypothetical protein
MKSIPTWHRASLLRPGKPLASRAAALAASTAKASSANEPEDSTAEPEDSTADQIINNAGDEVDRAVHARHSHAQTGAECPSGFVPCASAGPTARTIFRPVRPPYRRRLEHRHECWTTLCPAIGFLLCDVKRCGLFQWVQVPRRERSRSSWKLSGRPSKTCRTTIVIWDDAAL